MEESIYKDKVAKEEEVVGDWLPFQCMTNEATEVFEKAIEGFIGVKYTPVAFAYRIKNGKQYRFVCNAKAVYPEIKNEAAIVTIYHGPNESPYLTDIKRIYF